MKSLAVVLLVLSPAMLPAQGTDLRPVVARTPLHDVVRAELRDGRRVAGPLAARGDATFVLGADSATGQVLRYDDVTRFWQRRRAIGAGAIAGGVLGAGSGAFIAWVVRALCEYDCGGSLAGAAVIGAGIGGALGAGAGAIVGAAIPRWHGAWRGAAAAGGPVSLGTDSLPRPATRSRKIGELTLAGVAGAGGHDFTGMPFPPSNDLRGGLGGGAVGLAFRAGRFGLGPEVTLLSGGERLRAIGATARFALADETGAVTPHVVAGAGGYRWTATNFETSVLTLALGAGLTTSGGWRFEARWHPVVQNIDAASKATLVTLSAGHRWAW